MNNLKTQNQRSVISFKYLKSSKVHRRNNKQKEHKTTENTEESTKSRKNNKNTTKTTENHRKRNKIIRNNKNHVYKRLFLIKRIQNIEKIIRK